MTSIKTMSYYGVLVLINLLLFFILNGRSFNMSVPLLYSGDFLPTIALIKQIITGELPFFGYPTSELMSAPGKLEFADFPVPILSVWIFIQWISIFTDNHFLVLNIFILSSFILNPLAMYYVLRRFRVNILIAIVVATLYNFVPFHFFRLGHTLYIGYFLLPILTYFLLLMLSKKPLFYKYSTNGKYSFDFSKKNIFIMIVLLFSSTWNYYYTFFFLVLVGIVMLIRLIEQKNRYFFYSGLIVIGLSVTPFFINMLPYKFYTIENGKNMQVAQRGIGEAEIYGLKISQLLLPVDGHRIEYFANNKQKYNARTPLINENGTATLGIIGSLGFLLLIIYLLVQTKSASILKKLSYLNISAVMFATIGGFGAIFALLVTPELRGYNRISILIATFTLIAFALALNYIIKKYRIESWKLVLICLFILGIGLYDQIPKGMTLKPSEYSKILFESDKKFIKEIEKLHDLSTQGMVMQYPYMSYPEHPPIVNMGDYSQMIGYLHSDTIKWSYGAVRGRETDKWIASLMKESLEKQIEILKSSGFTGVYIDRRGYEDNAREMEKDLEKLLQTKPFVSDDQLKSFFKFMPTSNKTYKFNYPPEFTNGFYGWEGEHGSFGWTSGNASLKIINNEDQTMYFKLKMKLGTLEHRHVDVYFKGRTIEKIELDPGKLSEVELVIELLPGDNEINFKTNGLAKRPGNGDTRTLAFSIQSMNYQILKE